MKLFLEYLKYHIKSIGMFLGFSVIFTGVFLLYHLPPGAVFYGAVLCLFLAALIGIRDYSKFCRKHRELEYLKKEIRVTADHLPEAMNLIEEDYREVLGELSDEKQRLITSMEQKYREMMDYYTIWVHQIKTPNSGHAASASGGSF